jgi:hypothetical protein
MENVNNNVSRSPIKIDVAGFNLNVFRVGASPLIKADGGLLNNDMKGTHTHFTFEVFFVTSGTLTLITDTYTTEYNILVNVDGQTIRIPSVVEGVGTNLLGYRNYTHKEIKLHLADLKYSKGSVEDEQTGESQECYILDPQSIQNAISVRFSDIKIVSLGDIPPLPIPELQDVADTTRNIKSKVSGLFRGKKSSEKRTDKQSAGSQTRSEGDK